MNLLRLYDLPFNKVSYRSFQFDKTENGISNPRYAVDRSNGLVRNVPSLVWATLKDVTLLIEPGLDGVVYLDNNSLLWESKRFLRPGASNTNLFSQNEFRPLKQDEEIVGELDVAMMSFDPGWINYYHWLLLCLPGALHACASNSVGPILFPEYQSYHDRKISPAFSACVHQETLSRIHLLPQSVKFLRPGLYRIKELHYLVPQNAREQNKFFNSSFSREYISTMSGEETKRVALSKIFISRLRAGNNVRLSDEEHQSLASLAYECGYQEIILEKMTFDQQVKTFQSASHVFSAHGSGLANIIFSSNLSLFEYNNPFRDEPLPRHHFQVLSEQLGHRSCVIDRLILRMQTSELKKVLMSDGLSSDFQMSSG